MVQMGLFDLLNRYASLDAKKDPLLEIDAVVPWEEFRPALERIWRKPYADRKSRAGRKPIDAVLMFKTLVLSALYNLSLVRTIGLVRAKAKIGMKNLLWLPPVMQEVSNPVGV
jgi:hypothetical protein